MFYIFVSSGKSSTYPRGYASGFLSPELDGPLSSWDTMEFTEDQISRYSRHILLPEVGGKGQKKIAKAKVLSPSAPEAWFAGGALSGRSRCRHNRPHRQRCRGHDQSSPPDTALYVGRGPPQSPFGQRKDSGVEPRRLGFDVRRAVDGRQCDENHQRAMTSSLTGSITSRPSS